MPETAGDADAPRQDARTHGKTPLGVSFFLTSGGVKVKEREAEMGEFLLGEEREEERLDRKLWWMRERCLSASLCPPGTEAKKK